jgi:hypothetical protein
MKSGSKSRRDDTPITPDEIRLQIPKGRHTHNPRMKSGYKSRRDDILITPDEIRPLNKKYSQKIAN